MRRHTISAHIKSIQKGFTLIETLVSLAIFSVVMVVAGGIILSVISSNKQNQAINGVVNNLNYSIESMVRDIKTGYTYRCNYPVGNNDDYQLGTFADAANACVDGQSIDNITLISNITGVEGIVRYELVKPVGSAGFIRKTFYKESGGAIVVNSYPLTDTTNIDITDMSFRVQAGKPLYTNDVLNADAVQPGVFVLIKGTAKVNAVNISDFFIQTFISQRLPNLI